MQVLVWNCRGAGDSEFERAIMDLVRINNPTLVFLLETRLTASRIGPFKTTLGLHSSNGVDSVGLSSGIWMH